MARQSALRAGSEQVLRARLEALDGVERVLVDDERGEIWLMARSGIDRAALEESARSTLLALGVDPLAVAVEVASRAAHNERRRVRFVAIERLQEQDGRQVRVRVLLEWDGEIHAGEEAGEAGLALEMRTAAAAAVRAVETLAPDGLRLRLIGVKQIRAFDQEITVVSLFRNAAPPQRLVGAVLTADDPLRTTVLAVLNGLNRILGNYLKTVG